MSSAGKYYVVYWYPTIFHREKQRQAKVEFGFVDISDKSTLPLMLKKEEKGKNLQYNAKDLYHKHEIQDSSDGRLEAYLKNSDTGKYLTSEPDISTPNHEVIRFFIEQYETLFYNYAHSVSDQYSLVNQKLSKYFSLNINNKALKSCDPSSKDIEANHSTKNLRLWIPVLQHLYVWKNKHKRHEC